MTYSSLRALLVKRFNIPKERQIRKAIRSFTLAEKTVFYFFIAVFVVSGIALLWRVSNAFLVEVPVRGGTLTEGVVGTPRFINPVLAITDADKNITALVYSGLVRIDTQGQIVNDLAESVTVSKDGLTYTAHIRTDATFQDGTPVTADDVLFTIQEIQDPNLKSPLFVDWTGVTAQKVDAQTVTFTLKQPYAPFMDNLTVGILPKHIWANVSDDEFSFSQFNALPVGSGPFKIGSVKRDSGGIPDYYDLVPFSHAIGGAPYIGDFVFKFYSNEQDLLTAYANGDIDSMSGISPEDAATLKKGGTNIDTAPLSRVFGVFFNQSQNPIFLDKSVRQALDLSAPKEEIVQDVLGGYAVPIDGPLPPGLFPWSGALSTTSPINVRTTEAKAILAADGWTTNPQTGILEKKSKSGTLTLSFSISTGDAPELKAVADKLQSAWEGIGAHVDVLVFETGDLNQNVIRPRKFDTLLFGEVVGRDADVYPFWDSSERNDPGLNIAGYANSAVDKLLQDARTNNDPSAREQDYKAFDAQIRADVPAVFLYSPKFLYVVPDDVHAVTLGELFAPQDRFESVRDWYIESDRVWKSFVR